MLLSQSWLLSIWCPQSPLAFPAARSRSSRSHQVEAVRANRPAYGVDDDVELLAAECVG